MVTAPTTWTAAQRVTATALGKAGTAIGELQAAAPGMDSRIGDLESGDVLLYYVQTITGVKQSGADDNRFAQENPYSAWPTSGTFTGKPSGVRIPTDGKYVITFTVDCTSGSFWNEDPTTALRVSHWLFTGYDTTKNARDQTTAVCLAQSSTYPNGGEDMASVTATAQLSAGDIVTPAWYVPNAYGIPRSSTNPVTGWVTYWTEWHYANPVCTCRMVIVRIST